MSNKKFCESEIRKPKVSDTIISKLKVDNNGNLPFENDPFYWKRLYETADSLNKRLELEVKEKELENKMLRDEIDRLHVTIRAFSTLHLPAPASPTVSPWNKKSGIPDYARYSGPIKLSHG